jgi:hypothetical protein
VFVESSGPFAIMYLGASTQPFSALRAAFSSAAPNEGYNSFNQLSLFVTGTEFSVNGLNHPVTLATGESVTFSVIFTPQSAGNASGNLVIACNQNINCSPRKDRPAVSPGTTGRAVDSLSSIPGFYRHQNAHLRRDLDQVRAHNTRLSPAKSGAVGPFHWMRILPCGASNAIRHSDKPIASDPTCSMNIGDDVADLVRRARQCIARFRQPLQHAVLQAQNLGRSTNTVFPRHLRS